MLNLIIQPYVNRTIDDIIFTGTKFIQTMVWDEEDKFVFVPDSVIRLFPNNFDLEPEDKVLGDYPFILFEYEKAIKEADKIILITDKNESKEFTEINEIKNFLGESIKEENLFKNIIFSKDFEEILGSEEYCKYLEERKKILSEDPSIHVDA